MILQNLNYITIIVFIILLFLWGAILWWLYKRNNNKISIIFLLLSFLFLIINIFDIRWWFKDEFKEVKWWNVVFVMDVSKSMYAKDIRHEDIFSSRLNWTKDFIKNYISNYTNNKYGLMIFAWDAAEILPFTDDISIFNTVLYSLDDKNIWKTWTDFNSVFLSLTNYFSEDKDWWLVVILSDLWDEKIDYNKKLIEDFKSRNINFVIIWVGTTKWARIPVWKDFFWWDLYKKYNWKEVITKLNDTELKRMWTDLGIDYIHLNNYSNFDNIISNINKSVNLLDIEKSLNSRITYTREFIFISFIFFILYFISDSVLWQRRRFY